MLNVMAARLLAAMRSLPDTPALRLGEPTPGDPLPLVCVRVSELQTGASEAEAAGPVTPRKLVHWQADGEQRSFPLPELVAQVLEVRTPPGRRAHPGEHYVITPEGALRFHRPPKDDVVAELAEPARRGWQSQGPARVSLRVCALAEQAGQAERLLLRALGRALALLGEEDVFAQEPLEVDALRLRFLLDGVRMQGLRAGPHPLGQRAVERCEASLQLEGQLELSVVWAPPFSEGVLEELRARPVDSGEWTWDGRLPGPPPVTRPVEATPLSRLCGVGEATASKLEALTGAHTLGAFARVRLDQLHDLTSTGLSVGRVEACQARAQTLLALQLPADAPAALGALTLEQAGALDVEALSALLDAPAQRLAAELAAALEVLSTGVSEELTLADFQQR